MGEQTLIEWCDATLNLWTGCTKVSDGCKFCYAEQMMDQRFNRGNWGPTGTRQEVKSWRSTLNKISKRAKDEGKRLRVFCQSLSDTFEGSETMGGDKSQNWPVTSHLRTLLLDAIKEHPELDFLVLTKRPENVMGMVKSHNAAIKTFEEEKFEFPANCWIGTSIEDQPTADERIPHLLAIPAAVRFVSYEPALGPVDFQYQRGWLEPFQETDAMLNRTPRIDWLIAGGESGPNARPMHPDWARSLRDQCQAAGVPFFFKQWGEAVPVTFDDRCGIPDMAAKSCYWLTPDGNRHDGGFPPEGKSDYAWMMSRVGKKRAGRLLDGREWNEMPGVTA